MNRKLVLKILLVLFAGILVVGCGEKTKKSTGSRNRIRKSRKKKSSKKKGDKAEQKPLVEVIPVNYKGTKYRSPFSPKGRGAGGISTVKSSDSSTSVFSPDNLSVTGVFQDKNERNAILTSPDGYYIIKKGRLYSEDNNEVPAIAAIIKDDKIVLITNENTMYELKIPE